MGLILKKGLMGLVFMLPKISSRFDELGVVKATPQVRQRRGGRVAIALGESGQAGRSKARLRRERRSPFGGLKQARGGRLVSFFVSTIGFATRVSLGFKYYRGDQICSQIEFEGFETARLRDFFREFLRVSPESSATCVEFWRASGCLPPPLSLVPVLLQFFPISHRQLDCSSQATTPVRDIQKERRVKEDPGAMEQDIDEVSEIKAEAVEEDMKILDAGACGVTTALLLLEQQ